MTPSPPPPTLDVFAVRLTAAEALQSSSSPSPGLSLPHLCLLHCWADVHKFLPQDQRSRPQLSLTRSPLQGLQAAVAALAPAAAMSASEREVAVAAFFRSAPPSEPCLLRPACASSSMVVSAACRTSAERCAQALPAFQGTGGTPRAAHRQQHLGLHAADWTCAWPSS